MQTSFINLPYTIHEKLATITAIVIEETDPEKILLLSLPEHLPEPLNAYLDRYTIIILLKAVTCNLRNLQDHLEHRCGELNLPVTVFIHTTHLFNKILADNPYLFGDQSICTALLYNVGGTPLLERPRLSSHSLAMYARSYFDKWFSLAQAFYGSALFNLQQKALHLAAFMLHQTLEHAFITVHLVFTGYLPYTHSLDKLRRYAGRYSKALANVFPRNSEMESHLFNQVQTAYGCVRFKEYHITESECTLLAERISILLGIAAKVCQEKIQDIKTL